MASFSCMGNSYPVGRIKVGSNKQTVDWSEAWQSVKVSEWQSSIRPTGPHIQQRRTYKKCSASQTDINELILFNLSVFFYLHIKKNPHSMLHPANSPYASVLSFCSHLLSEPKQNSKKV